MKRLIITTLSIIAVCFGINAAAAHAKHTNTPDDCIRTYIFREYNGVVACFEEDEDEPFLVTNVPVKNLTPIDRVLLSAGVEVHGAAAMSRALEDYCS